MLTTRSLRDVTLATLLMFGASGCIIVQGTPYPSRPVNTTSRPKPAKPKPAQPKPAQPKPHPAQPPPKPAQPTPHPRPVPTPAPRPTPQPTPTPQPGAIKGTHMVVPVRVAFAEAVQRIDSMVQKTMTQDWRNVSNPKDPTQIDVRYTAWRDPIQASFDNNTLHVSVSVRYAADFRATRKIAGKRVWITKGDSWGTKADPQVITAKFHASFAINPDFTVSAKAELDDLDFGKAPAGAVCVKALAKICVTKATIAPMVNKNLEQQIVPMVQKALDDADQQVEQALNVKAHAQQLWTLIQQPQPLAAPGQANCPTELGGLCKTPAWFVARPESVGISQPRMDGNFLRVDLALAGQMSVALGRKPAVSPSPLPKLSPVTDPPGFAVRAKLQLPLAVLGAELSKQLQGKKFGGAGRFGNSEIVISRVSLGHPDLRNPRRLQVVVSVDGAYKGDLTLAGEVAYDGPRHELFLKDFDYTLDTDNAALKKMSAANHDAIRRQIAEKARWRLDTRTGALADAITRSLGNVWRGHLDVDGRLDTLLVDGYSIAGDVLSADVVLAGQLGVSFTP
jgi:hypothetical protein